MTVWYAVSCENQDEYEVFYDLRKHSRAGAVREVFLPTYERMRKYQGEWHTEEQLLFPKKVFVECADADACVPSNRENWMQTDGVRGFGDPVKAPEVSGADIRRYRSNWTALSDAEVAVLKEFAGNGRRIGMSVGRIKNGVTQVTEGPLIGKEPLIRKIDRHKRLAWVEIPAVQGVDRVCMGLEIVSKD